MFYAFVKLSVWSNNSSLLLVTHCNLLDRFLDPKLCLWDCESCRLVVLDPCGKEMLWMFLKELLNQRFSASSMPRWAHKHAQAFTHMCTDVQTFFMSLSRQMRMSTLGERDRLSVHQRFGLGCVSGAVAHAVFYPLEVSQWHNRLELLTVRCCLLNMSFFRVQYTLSNKNFLSPFFTFRQRQAMLFLVLIQQHEEQKMRITDFVSLYHFHAPKKNDGKCNFFHTNLLPCIMAKCINKWLNFCLILKK